MSGNALPEEADDDLDWGALCKSKKRKIVQGPKPLPTAAGSGSGDGSTDISIFNDVDNVGIFNDIDEFEQALGQIIDDQAAQAACDIVGLRGGEEEDPAFDANDKGSHDESDRDEADVCAVLDTFALEPPGSSQTPEPRPEPSRSSSSVVGVADSKIARAYVPAVGLGEIYCQEYAPALGRGYANWILMWQQEGQRREKKRLVTDNSTKRHGGIEPIAYLHAYRDLVLADDARVAANPRAHPPVEAIDEQVQQHRAQFEFIHGMFF